MNAIHCNYHTHSKYCDGQGDIETYVQEAIRCGLDSIGFSSHAPCPNTNRWTMPLPVLSHYVADVRRCAEVYRSQIQVYLGLELDFVPSWDDFQQRHILNTPLDYVIGSVHFVGGEGSPNGWTVDGPPAAFDAGLQETFQGDVKRLVQEYFARTCAMVQTGHLDVVGHLDRILYNNIGEHHFSTDAAWYRLAVEESLAVIAERDKLVELNVSGCYAPLGAPNPSPYILERCQELGIRMTVGSDAHHPKNVARGLDRAAGLLHEAGFKEVWQLTPAGWAPHEL